MTALKLVTLDMTGTMLAFKTPVMEQYASVAAHYGIQSDVKKLQDNFKSAWKLFSRQHPNFGLNTGMGWQNWWRNVVFHTFKDNKEIEPKLSTIADVLLNHFETDKAWCLVDGGNQLLKSLKERGLKLGIISNFDPRLHTILKSLKIQDYFDFVLISYEFGYPKPDIRIFVEALKRSSVDSPSKALHVGNDKILDFQAANEAGFHSVLIDSSQNEKFPSVLKNVKDVIRAVDYFNENENDST